MSNWTQSIPLWVSRESAGGMTSTFSVPAWLFMLIGLIVLINILTWGVIGIVEAIDTIVNAF